MKLQSAICNLETKKSAMLKILFKPTNRSIEVAAGENLLQAAAKADVHINASCGGEGTCGKCKVVIEGTSYEADNKSKLTGEEIEKGYALACQTIVYGDLIVSVPLESELIAKTRGRIKTLTSTTESWNEQLESLDLNPKVFKRYVEPPKPSLQDSVSDASRILRLIKRDIETADIVVELTVLKDLEGLVRDADWKVTATLIREASHYRLIRIEAGDTTGRQYAVAVDVGTTTCVGALVDLNQKKILCESSEYNGQISLGDDVISRMVFAKKGDGLKLLQQRVAETIDKLIKNLLRKSKVGKENIDLIVAAGNTIMTHLLYGVTTDRIREAPYVPVFSFPPIVGGADLGIKMLPQAKVVAFPCVASYLGGDITAGVVASGLVGSDRLTLYIDIGTNGEIVLAGGSNWLVGCSCSAGPAFEGGGVKDGIRSIEGAIERVSIERDTFETVFTTIGDKLALGICGSGLIDLLAELFLTGVIDKRGKINGEIDTKRIRKDDQGGWEYVVAWKNMTATGDDIVISEVDIDNLMRAKAAVFAGITTLVEGVGVNLDDIDEILIAGSFGNYIRIKEAITIGLLPDVSEDKYKFVGNGSLYGCAKAAVNQDILAEAGGITKNMSYQELSADNTFMEKYMSALFLPHTNDELFPSVKRATKKRLES